MMTTRRASGRERTPARFKFRKKGHRQLEGARGEGSGGIGRAMDIAVGARRLIVRRRNAKDGAPKWCGSAAIR